jgi:hypothetical protein
VRWIPKVPHCYETGQECSPLEGDKERKNVRKKEHVKKKANK